MNAQKLYIETGNVIATARSKISLNGARKGEATSTAIMLDPSGRTLNKGIDRKLYMVLAKGDSRIAHIPIEDIMISSLFLSSSK